MRHRKAGYKLGRTASHRQAMLRNMAASLFEHGQIVTTRPKAKAVQPIVEKIVTKAKHAQAALKAGDEVRAVHLRRQIAQTLGRDRHAFEWTYLPKHPTDDERQHVEELRGRAEQYFDIPASSEVEMNRYGELRKAPKLVRHIVDNVAPRFEDRNGGYTRIIKLGYRRLGDQAETVLIQFVGAEEGPEIKGRTGTRRKQADRRSDFAKKLRAEREPTPEDSAPSEAPTAVATAEAPDAAPADPPAGETKNEDKSE